MEISDMVVKLLSAATVMAAASTSNAAFESIGLDLGAALGSLGSPIQVVGGTLYSSAATGGSADVFIHNLLSGSSAAAGAGVGIAAVAPSAPTHTPGVNQANAFAGIDVVENYLDSASFITANPTQIQGVYFNNNIINSGVHPLTGNDAMWFGRFGVTQGATFDPNSTALATIREPGEANETTVAANFAGTAVPAAYDNGFTYRLRFDLVASAVPLVDNNGAPGPFDVYDMWIEQIPTPGSMALMGLAGFAAVRRRRA